jgi:hypothetical protein
MLMLILMAFYVECGGGGSKVVREGGELIWCIENKSRMLSRRREGEREMMR